ncbi:hypothetical protein [uncultured Thiohalocapsa sp.]|nr:hypothetical protein [uncultured Thiohalocapsa sp.]
MDRLFLKRPLVPTRVPTADPFPARLDLAGRSAEHPGSLKLPVAPIA